MSASFPRPGDAFGRYSILEELGRGGMGVVMRARQDDLGREVALKVLSPELADQEEFATRFRREASLLAAVDSPHIIAVYDHGEHDGRLYIATQLVRGGDLARLLREHGPLPLDQGLHIVSQLASALDDAHSAGVLHRDVKPGNVLLREGSDGWRAYLCDFGIAHTHATDLTQAGTVVGTYGFLAPERCEGRPATVESDVYALGCVLVAALTGDAPYSGSDFQVARQHISAPIPQWEPTFPGADELNIILRRSMAKRPEDRYSSAQEMRRDLRTLGEALRHRPEAARPLAEETVVPQQPPALTPPPIPPSDIPRTAAPRRGTGRTLGYVALAAVLVALLGLGGLLAFRPQDGRTPVSSTTARDDSPTQSTSPTTTPTTTPSTTVSPPQETTAGEGEAGSSSPAPAPVAFPRRDVGCTGGFITVIPEKVSFNDSPESTIEAMQVFARDKRYTGRYTLRYTAADSASACENLTPGGVNPRLGYLPYLGPFNSAHDACQVRLDLTPRDSYVVKLDPDVESASPCACQFSAGETPALSKTIGQAPTPAERVWVSGAQTLFKILGYNTDDERSGDYGPKTIRWVTRLQEEYGLENVTGDLDGETWDVLKQATCPDD